MKILITLIVLLWLLLEYLLGMKFLDNFNFKCVEE